MSTQDTADAHARNEDYWNRTYGRVGKPIQPSSFAQSVIENGWIGPQVAAVVDLGCGTARDTAHVAQDRPGLGLDYSHVVTGKNQEYWAERPNLTFRQADVRDAAALEAVLKDFAAAHGGPLALYSRFFLHAIDDEAESSLLKALKGALPSGSVALLEFRTHLDRDLEKVFDDHYRRFVDPDDFVQRFLKAVPSQVRHQEAGRGLAPYKDEDPHVARLVLDVL